MDAQKFCLKWDGFQSSVTSVFDHLRQDSELVDVTLCCEGQRVRAHRMMLSACSPYFRELFKDLCCQQLVVFLKDTSAADLNAVIEFIYKGSVNVSQSQLASFIKTAEMLQVQGLSGGDDKEPSSSPVPPPPPLLESGRPSSPSSRPRRATDATASPGEPHLKRRRPEPPPPPPPPPPTARADGPPLPKEEALEPTDGHYESPVKVEKFDVDLTLDDDEYEGGPAGSELEAALGDVAQYEGYDPGSDQSLSADGQLFAADGDAALSGSAAGPGGPYLPGPSPRTGEDNSQGGFACDICGRWYRYRRSLRQHRTVHAGMTTCRVCGKVSNRVADLRIHLQMVHKMSAEEVRQAVPPPAVQRRRTR